MDNRLLASDIVWPTRKLRASNASDYHAYPSSMEVTAVAKRKKWKLVGLDKALEGVPPEERAGVAAKIEEMFQDFDPETLRRARSSSRARDASLPCCGGSLVELAILPRPDGQPDRELVLECDACDATSLSLFNRSRISLPSGFNWYRSLFGQPEKS